MRRHVPLLLLALLAPAAGAQAGNTDPLDAGRDLVGKTLSGVAFLPRPVPVLGPTATGTPSLNTVMFQAYLEPNGTAQVRSWDPSTDKYTAIVTEHWHGAGDQLCLTVPAFALPGELCISLYSWGPEFGGTGVNHTGMVKGDVQDGSLLH
jgi:hypothetical protein